MKTLRIFLVAAIMSIALMSATYTDPITESVDTQLRDRIANLVDQPNFSISDQTIVKVMFQLNDQGEIVVINVDTNDASLDGYIKSRLNYKSAKLDSYKSGLDYYIDLKFKQG